MIRKLSGVMKVDEIAHILDWDISSVEEVFKHISNNPDMADEEVAEKIGLL